MVGFDEYVAIMEDWMPPSPSPRTIFSSMSSNGFAESGNENTDRSFFPGPEGKGMFEISDQNNQNGASAEENEACVSNAMAEQRTGSGGGLMERRTGFNASKLNTENISNSEVGSPAFVIPPGPSPTSFLLESPVLLSNSLVLPSPTTGKFLFASSGNSTLMTHDSVKGKESTCEDVNDSSFAFKRVVESSSFPYFNAVNKGFAPQSSVGFSTPSDTSVLNQSLEPYFQSKNNSAVFQQAKYSESHLEINRSTSLNSDHSPPLDEPYEDDGDQRSGGDPNIGNDPEADGYNWRKYGQKQVKGSEYPRSYYKCASQNCPVKKKIERSPEGHITEIIYKGAHDHPKPLPNCRSTIGSSSGLGEIQLNSEQVGTDSNGGLACSNMQKKSEEYSIEATNTTLHGQSGVKYESVDGAEGSSAFSNDNEEDDRATRVSASLGYDGEGDESESKRRKSEPYASELTGASRAIREPRVVVQTTSEVDILDDGYRWRKYGQKVVKGNPNPRSYYKCTSTGCNVRKHVERACHDLKSVITTYEGKHNHDVPAARNTNHLNSGGSAFPTQQPPSSSASNRIQRSEPSQTREHFERPQLGSYDFQGRPQMGPGPGFGYGMSQPGLAGLGMARLGPNQGKLPALGVNPYLGHQTRPTSDIGFIVPKDEPKLEPVMDSDSNPPPNQALLYQQFMSQLPLGPQM